MNSINEFLVQNKFGNLATCIHDKPYTRPFELAFQNDKGMFFYASRDEDLVNQLKTNPNVCFCATDSNYNYVKVDGSVVFSDAAGDKAEILEKSAFAKDVYSGSNLDKMQVFSLPHGNCMMHLHNDNKVITDKF
jgi:uncharacterized pyridoxamine 5'-phosphate oxidase family protein